MTTLCRRLAAALATCSALLVTVVSSANAATPVPLSGAYVGAANLQGLQSFATWRGAPVRIAEDYLPYTDWSAVEGPAWWLSDWKPLTSGNGKLVLGVPLLTSGGTFADGAAGAYDSYFASLATELVQAGDGSAMLRLGWEFNGPWYPWSLSSTNSGDSPKEFITYWQRIVTLMRAIAPGLQFDWNVYNGAGAVDATEAYPGNAYVDDIGVDVYDAGHGVSTPSVRWKQIVTKSYGLNFWDNFASQNGKPLTIPEWGLSTGANGGGDDPYFITQMYDWMRAHDVGFEAYFDYQGSLTSGSFAQSAAEYRALYSSRGGAGSSAAAHLRQGSLRVDRKRAKNHRKARARRKVRRHGRTRVPLRPASGNVRAGLS